MRSAKDLGGPLTLEIFRSPSSVDPSCDSSRSFVDYRCEDEEVVRFEATSMAVKYSPKAF